MSLRLLTKHHLSQKLSSAAVVIGALRVHFTKSVVCVRPIFTFMYNERFKSLVLKSHKKSKLKRFHRYVVLEACKESNHKMA